jgi:hypothetical protein
VIIRNLTIAFDEDIKRPFAGLQYTIIDRNQQLSADDTILGQDQSVPLNVIIIAISIGGVIMGLCVCGVCYVIC